MRLSATEVESLVHAAEATAFPEFWAALIVAVRISGISPLRLLGPRGPGRVPESHRRDVERLEAAVCPFDLFTSRWGCPTMLGAFRQLADRAGIEGADELEFEALYG